jgi:uncharacterized membrane protein
VLDLVDLVQVSFETVNVLSIVETMGVELWVLSEVVQDVLLKELLLLKLVDVTVVVEVLNTLHFDYEGQEGKEVGLF